MKLGICIQGGGSRGLYVANPLDILLQNGIDAEEVFGTSCGGLMGANYVSGDLGRNEKIALFIAKDRHYFRPLGILGKKRTMFDYPYLIYEVPKKGIPFSFDRFAKNPCKFYVVCSSCRTGGTLFYEKNQPDFLPTALAASAALPLTSNPVVYGSEPCLDGGVTCPIAFEKALEDGCDKVIVLATQVKGYRKKPLKKQEWDLVKRMYKNYPAWLAVYRRSIEIYNSQMAYMDLLGEEGKIAVLYPSKDLHISHSERNVGKLTALMELGRQDCLAALPQIKEYLSK
jgi:predicted patatin/cPLA2 family phospholipase